MISPKSSHPHLLPAFPPVSSPILLFHSPPSSPTLQPSNLRYGWNHQAQVTRVDDAFSLVDGGEVERAEDMQVQLFMPMAGGGVGVVRPGDGPIGWG